MRCHRSSQNRCEASRRVEGRYSQRGRRVNLSRTRAVGASGSRRGCARQRGSATGECGRSRRRHRTRLQSRGPGRRLARTDCVWPQASACDSIPMHRTLAVCARYCTRGLRPTISAAMPPKFHQIQLHPRKNCDPLPRPQWRSHPSLVCARIESARHSPQVVLCRLHKLQERARRLLRPLRATSRSRCTRTRFCVRREMEQERTR